MCGATATLDTVPSYLVEAYLADTPSALADARARAHLAARSDRGVRYVRSTFLPADETVLHLFEAVSDDVVRRAAGRVELGYQRIVEAIEGPPTAHDPDNLTPLVCGDIHGDPEEGSDAS